ncbi:2Fe-2S iron-sulfur cluster-binding protein [Rhodanobacter sp. Si-c]|uniref:2Fe-2S iron-sulfur cluster-binding protein n=1 Tax=Rhodanobacter lycopersici TaxID=3162487 RepID=A0ABV3QGM2_9GAMM
MTQNLQAVVTSRHGETESIAVFELRACDGGELPAFTAGAHVDLHLPNGLVRSYSLTNDQGERNRYVIGVSRDMASRGGSQYVHEHVRVGTVLTIGGPRNNFQLDEGAACSIFIAGGIGITPILSMTRRMEKLGLPWTLHYCARSRSHAAYLDYLSAPDAFKHGRVVLHFDQESGRMLDIDAIVAGAGPGTHLYCCGPTPMLGGFEQAMARRPDCISHVEYFANTKEAAVEGGFEVVLARAGCSVAVAPGKSILDALLEAGIEAPYSCHEGVCGTCETRVLEGEPDHRDLVLSRAEHESGKVMMICVSGCKGKKLVLDM